MPGQFGYLLGGLSAEIAGDVLDYAQRYSTAKNGFVLLSKRAASLRNSILGRIPNLAPLLPRFAGEERGGLRAFPDNRPAAD
jgi:predicted metal-binding protein